MKRLSLAELKAKANVVANTEFIVGGSESGCHCPESDTITITVRPPVVVVEPLPPIPLKPIQ